MALEDFAANLDANQIRAVHAARSEWSIEGPYWLAKTLGKAYQTVEDQARTTCSSPTTLPPPCLQALSALPSMTLIPTLAICTR